MSSLSPNCCSTRRRPLSSPLCLRGAFRKLRQECRTVQRKYISVVTEPSECRDARLDCFASEKNLRYPMDKRSAGPQKQSGCDGWRGTSLLPPAVHFQLSGPPALNLDTANRCSRFPVARDTLLFDCDLTHGHGRNTAQIPCQLKRTRQHYEYNQTWTVCSINHA
jgi:hypothetical protein